VQELIKRGYSRTSASEWLKSATENARIIRASLPILPTSSQLDRVRQDAQVISTLAKSDLPNADILLQTGEKYGLLAAPLGVSCPVFECGTLEGNRRLDSLPHSIQIMADAFTQDTDTRAVVENYLLTSGVATFRLGDSAQVIVNSVDAFKGNAIILDTVSTLLNSTDVNSAAAAALSTTFDRFDTAYGALTGANASLQDRLNAVSDLRSGVEIAAQFAGFINPAVGSTISQFGDALQTFQQASEAFDAASTVETALMCANSYALAANIGMSLLSGGSPLSGLKGQGGGDAAAMKQIEGMFDQINKELKNIEQTLNKRFDEVDKRLDALSAKLDDVERGISSLTFHVDQLSDDVASLRGLVINLQESIDDTEHAVALGARFVVETEFDQERARCFASVQVDPLDKIIPSACLATFASYALDSVKTWKLFAQTTAGQDLESSLLRWEPSAQTKDGFDTKQYVIGARAYTAYLSRLISRGYRFSDSYKKIITADVNSLLSLTANNGDHYRLLLWRTDNNRLGEYMFKDTSKRGALVYLPDAKKLGIVVDIFIHLASLKSKFDEAATFVKNSDAALQTGGLCDPGGHRNDKVYGDFVSRVRNKFLTFSEVNAVSGELLSFHNLIISGIPTFLENVKADRQKAFSEILSFTNSDSLGDFETRLFVQSCASKMSPQDEQDERTLELLNTRLEDSVFEFVRNKAAEVKELVFLNPDIHLVVYELNYVKNIMGTSAHVFARSD
jgi:hypothetical protein